MVCGKCKAVFSDITNHVCESGYIVYVDIVAKESINPLKPKPRDVWTLAVPRPISFSGIIDSTGKLT